MYQLGSPKVGEFTDPVAIDEYICSFDIAAHDNAITDNAITSGK